MAVIIAASFSNFSILRAWSMTKCTTLIRSGKVQWRLREMIPVHLPTEAPEGYLALRAPDLYSHILSISPIALVQGWLYEADKMPTKRLRSGFYYYCSVRHLCWVFSSGIHFFLA